MSCDLILGFRSKPSDLTEVLEKQGFKLNRTIKVGSLAEDDLETRNYIWFDEQKSRRGVHINYTDGRMYYEEEGLLELEPDLAAQASVVSYTGRNDCDLQKQRSVARFLRDTFQAVLYDPQIGEEVKD